MCKFSFESFANSIVGTWKGEGLGVFPTIKNFEFIEHLVFKKDEERAIIHYEQRTWLKPSSSQKRRSSHWESGFISFENEEQFCMNNVHENGRMECLNLNEIKMSKDSYQLLFESRLIINDERMQTSKREWNFDSRKFNYEMFMGTKTVKQQQLHLSACLIKEM
ncbi:FABP family protein [uncultured Olleya sp.]|uniref:FABP family protein n=1 Tax=uncultured Olleya sp. TaxID=757243 RepID=UPI00048FA644|nr:FABP family protein [uncultured Olleya sp.]